MKIKKLNARGFSHELALILFVVIFAIGGAFYFVSSHADGCIAPVSVAVSNACGSRVTCTISGVPAEGTYKQVVSPKLKLVNRGGTISRMHVDVTILNNGSSNSKVLKQYSFIQALHSGHTSTHNLPSYHVRHASSSAQSVEYRVNYSSGGCNASVTLPIAPATGTTGGGTLL